MDYFSYQSVNDSSITFTYKAAPYAAKLDNGDGPYYISTTEDYVKHLVNEVEKERSLKWRHISTDRLYACVPLAKWLYDHNITTRGRLNTVRISIADELKCRENFSATCHIESKEKKSIYNKLFSENKIHWTQERPYAAINETNSRNNQRWW